ncbi:ligand-dependent corepressor isoform X2 [Bombina bombina]|uniref:ligand-dependent corepressor isoform X2 n=1 Tax=Bombina bombina TaxID=8345 RepID=UPI00235AD97F|nr:ligand-dependent corepressor isoform X2 [Bombina bombina]
MQRMIRQFAAEYTSKTSSTQDSSQPNSTKNQSLPKLSSGQNSPPPATAQNPVLSKLLMADQDSPLDLTVKKPQSEENCEQDGVLDLSTKKSPCAGSTFASVSPSTSNSIGNGTQNGEKKAIESNNSTNVTLEKFMVKLCGPHQKQFIHVLNNMCTEEQLINPEKTIRSDSQTSPYKMHFSEDCPGPEDHSTDMSLKCSAGTGGCSLISFKQVEHTVENKLVTCNKSSEKSALACTKHVDNLLCEADLISCSLRECSGKAITENARDPTFDANLTTVANEENILQDTPNTTHFSSDMNDFKLKLDNLHSEIPKNDNLNSLENNTYRRSSVCKTNSYTNYTQTILTRPCKITPGLRVNEYDEKCDIVYISKPISENHFEKQRAVLCSQDTPRKTSHKCFFSGGCCEVSTVCTLLRSSTERENGNSACLEIRNTSGIPSTEVESLVYLENSNTDCNSLKMLPCIDACSEHISVFPYNESKIQLEKTQGVTKQPVEKDHSTGTLITLLSVVPKEKEQNCARSQNINISPINSHEEEFHKQCHVENTTNENKGNNFVLVSEHEKDVNHLEQNMLNGIAHLNTSCHDEIIHTCVDPVSKTSLGEKIISNFGAVIESDNTFSLKVIERESPIILKDSCTNPFLSLVVSNMLTVKESDPLSCDTLLFTETSADICDREMVKDTEDEQSSSILSQNNINIELVPNEKTKTRTSATEHNCFPHVNMDEPFIATTSDVYCLIDNYAKSNLISSDVQRDPLNPGEASHFVNTNFGNGDSSQTKNVVGEKYTDKKVLIKSSLKGSKNVNCKNLKTLKKKDKVLVTSDRRLRSQEIKQRVKHSVLENDAPTDFMDHSLQVKLCKRPGRKKIERIVYIRWGKKIHFVTDDALITLCDITPNDSDCEQSLHSKVFTQRNVSDRIFRNISSTAFNLSTNLQICIDLGSNKRSVCFPTESKEFLLNVTNTFKDTGLENTYNVRLSSESTFISLSRSKNKAVGSKTLKNKRLAGQSHTLKSSSTEKNYVQPIAIEKPFEHSLQHSGFVLNTASSNSIESDRPKFVDWCSDEENQERISNFNKRYMSLHKSWISLEKEASLAHKSKSKYDKLKEIWKTKKRVRKNKIEQEFQKCSPVQMLFMNSYNLSDICKWFMGTTETKSLVIVKKINTRLPEDLPLPIIPVHKYPLSELYPHMLQAQRLKKYLKKFASVYPVQNDHKIQKSMKKLFENKKVQSDEAVDKSQHKTNEAEESKGIQSLVNLNRSTSIQILRKYNNMRGNLKNNTISRNPKKKRHAIKIMEDKNNYKHQCVKSVISYKQTSQVKSDSPAHKSTKNEVKQRGRKRCKKHPTDELGVQQTRKRKLELKTTVSAKRLHISSKNASPSTKRNKNTKSEPFTKHCALKTRVAKNKTSKSPKHLSLKSENTKTKHSRKAQLVTCKLKRETQTRSAKPKMMPQKAPKQRNIKKTTSPQRKKKISEKTLCNSTNETKNSDSLQQMQKHRSKADSPIQSKRWSLEIN